jgi:hypothetical protein
MIHDKKTRSVKAADVIKIMHERGEEIDEKKAEEVLDLMYFLAELIVKQNFTHTDSGPALNVGTDQDQ